MSISKKSFGITPCGKNVDIYTLKNAFGTELNVLTYGLRIQKLLVSDKSGNFGDVVLGYDNLEQYLGADFQGAFIGRYGNRIGKAKFTLDGITYNLTKNDGNNTLHGGPNGYHQIVWNVESTNDSDQPSIAFTYISPDMDENYPGTLKMKVTYTLSDENEVILAYEAVSDKATPFNPTNHSFFNLTGDHSKKIFDTVLKINASNITEVDDELIPTGEILHVGESPLDFINEKPLGEDMFTKEHTIQLNGGFDHNFCVDGTGMRLHAVAKEPVSGRIMEVYSDMPGIQLYTFNKANNSVAKNGVIMTDHTAFCLETQFYPDSVNHKNFPSAYLKANTPFTSTTVYKFK